MNIKFFQDPQTPALQHSPLSLLSLHLKDLLTSVVPRPCGTLAAYAPTAFPERRPS